MGVEETIIQHPWIYSLGLMTVPILIGSLVALAYYFYERNTRIFQLGSKIPGPPPIPFFGNAHIAIGFQNEEIFKLATRLADVYGNGDIARVFFGNKLVVVLMHPDDIEIILNSNVHLQKSDEYRFFKPWLGDGLLISSGEKWRSHRKIIAPAFHQNVLKTFVNVFNSNSRAVVDRMTKERGKVFDVHEYMSEVTVDILLETAMGTARSSQDHDGFEYAMAVMKMCDIIHQRHYKIDLRYDPIFYFTKTKQDQEKYLGTIHGLTTRVFQDKKKNFQKNAEEGNLPKPSLEEIINNPKTAEAVVASSPKKGLRDDLDEQDENDVGEKRRLAFLDLMIETAYSGSHISDSEIKEEVDTIMFEGHDTTAAGSSFCLCLLAIHKDIQEKVYQEQKAIFGDSNRFATFADTVEMKYLERVILESLRLYPPVPIIARQVNEDVKIVTGGHVIPKGATVVIGTFLVHRRKDVYKNPLVFDPDNFLPERTQNRHYYSFIPFSAGPRSCVGRKFAMLKLKVLLSTIVRNFHLKSNLTEEDFQLQGDIILKRADGFRLEIEPRQNAASAK
ncbi:cytochrome P450 4g1-like [Phlebotomus argentipes]|uniref:cytochrome P450 4g1-like n=1 Tax=Phlebotomus argentipes TaxID=94469 RepID=UPI0028937276|nr:cytochrome P450 4g1-like [Phlebotomus argentipes]